MEVIFGFLLELAAEVCCQATAAITIDGLAALVGVQWRQKRKQAQERGAEPPPPSLARLFWGLLVLGAFLTLILAYTLAFKAL